jgi:hypothetical protein
MLLTQRLEVVLQRRVVRVLWRAEAGGGGGPVRVGVGRDTVRQF